MRLVFILLIATQILNAQEYAFQIEFEDNAGNKDSIVVGLDSLATLGIDSIFGEVNIKDIPFSDGLDVRLTDEETTGYHSTYHTKKQIVGLKCYVLEINLKTNNYPIIARWNKDELFEQDPIRKAVFTGIHPGGWWDTEGISNLDRVNLIEMDSVIFTANFTKDIVDESFSYINEENDTISVFWFTFDPPIGGSTENQKNNEQIVLYPNPTHEEVNIINMTNQKIESTSLYTRLGVKRIKKAEIFESIIYLSDLETGLYWLVIEFENSRKIVRKIFKY
jgi:hypothetical protein